MDKRFKHRTHIRLTSDLWRVCRNWWKGINNPIGKKKAGHQDAIHKMNPNGNQPLKNLYVHQHERGEQSEIAEPLYTGLANVNPWSAAEWGKGTRALVLEMTSITSAVERNLKISMNITYTL